MRSSHVIDLLMIESGITHVDVVPPVMLPGLTFYLRSASKISYSSFREFASPKQLFVLLLCIQALLRFLKQIVFSLFEVRGDRAKDWTLPYGSCVCFLFQSLGFGL